MPQEMLQRLALSSPSHLLPERFQLPLRERPVKLKVEFDPPFSEGICQQVLDIQARMLNLLFSEVRCGALEDFKDRHVDLFTPRPPPIPLRSTAARCH